MTIELRWIEGTDSHLECDWGTFGNSEIDPRRTIEPLMLITPDVVDRILEHGPEPGIPAGGTVSCSRDGERLFCHLEYEGAGWTWELFKAHWWDGHDMKIYVGKWPAE
jgi:hypothetical protein